MSEESTKPASAAGGTARPRLLDQVRETIRRKYYSRRTEEAYVHWTKRFIYFTGKRHPATLGEAEVTAFLSDLAVTRRVAAATQNQALSALLFLYKEVLGVKRAMRPPRLPTVLTQDEVARLLVSMEGTRWLLASLLYGAGLRVIECLRLRARRASPSRSTATHCGIHSPPTFWNRGTTSEPCRNCPDTRMSRRR